MERALIRRMTFLLPHPSIWNVYTISEMIIRMYADVVSLHFGSVKRERGMMQMIAMMVV
jgi:hypothetical protein